MHITILTLGSRGDVQPYVALGVRLQQSGYDICLVAPVAFESFVTEHGLDCVPLDIDMNDVARRMVDEAGFNVAHIMQIIAEMAIDAGDMMQERIFAATADTDLVFYSFISSFIGHMVATEKNIPGMLGQLYPMFLSTAERPLMLAPDLPRGFWTPAYNRATYAAYRHIFNQTARTSYAILRRRLPHLPPIVDFPFMRDDAQRPPVLYGYSPAVLPPAPDRKRAHVTGYWFLDEPDWTPPDDLLAFLDAGSPPVYIGFGSMVTESMSDIRQTVIEALARTGQRGILMRGWGGLSAATLPDHIFMLDSAPHRWLFPRMAAVIHHGGVGTTAAGLRAGVPTLIVPFTADQPFWGRRVYQLGAGLHPIPRKTLTIENLSAAINRLIYDQPLRQRAAEIGARIRQEDGTGEAVRWIEHYAAQMVSG